MVGYSAYEANVKEPVNGDCVCCRIFFPLVSADPTHKLMEVSSCKSIGDLMDDIAYLVVDGSFCDRSKSNIDSFGNDYANKLNKVGDDLVDDTRKIGEELLEETKENINDYIEKNYCVSDNGINMDFSTAFEIAQESECVVDRILSNPECRKNVIQFDLDSYDSNCLAVCSVNINTRESETNWMCTGLLY